MTAPARRSRPPAAAATAPAAVPPDIAPPDIAPPDVGAAGARLSAAEVAAIFARFRAADPEPRGELDYVDPFTLLVAVVLSAQATDAGVNKATKALFRLADTPQKMLALGEDRVRDLIKTIGLYRNKAKNVVLLSEALIARHGGAVPDDRDALVALPGVGRKTANVVLNIAFGRPTMAVDTHVFRVANRTGLAAGRTPEAVEAGLLAVIPDEFLRHGHHWLILHGRYVCTARRPHCAACRIADLCRFPDKAPDLNPPVSMPPVSMPPVSMPPVSMPPVSPPVS